MVPGESRSIDMMNEEGIKREEPNAGMTVCGKDLSGEYLTGRVVVI